MKTLRAIGAGAFAVALLATGGCVSESAYKQLENQNRQLNEVISGLRTRNRSLEDQNQKLAASTDRLKGQAQGYKELAETAEEGLLSLEAKFAQLRERNDQDFPDGEVEVYRSPEGTGYRIQEAVLFDSGSDVLKPAGQDVLRRLGTSLREQTGRIRVSGHTDNDPVVKTRDKWPLGNLQLSTARALRVADFLIKEAGLPAGRVHVAGWGEHDPQVQNTSPENKRRNRRVELVVLD
ncbi:MAG: OmpA family protein [Planctomycetota bacterium]